MRGSQAKLFESVIYNFLTFPKYYILCLQTKQIVICTITGAARRAGRGFKFAGQDIFLHILDIFTFLSEYYSYFIMLRV